MQTRLETSADRDLRHRLDASEHDAWLAYRRAKHATDASDSCCDSRPSSQVHPLALTFHDDLEVATAA